MRAEEATEQDLIPGLPQEGRQSVAVGRHTLKTLGDFTITYSTSVASRALRW